MGNPSAANLPQRDTSNPERRTTPGNRVEVLIDRYMGILEQDPRESFAFQRLLDLYRERDGNVDSLVSELEQRAAGDPQSFAPRMLLGHIYKSQNRLVAARRAYEEAAALRPDDAVPRIAMANIDRTTDRLGDARHNLEAAVSLVREPTEQRELLRALGEVSLQQEDFEGAAAFYGRIAHGARGSVYLLTEYARALVARDHHERAIAEYQRVVSTLRGDNRVVPPVLLELARAQLNAGDVEGSIETLDRALRLSGRESGIRVELYDVMLEAYRRGDRLPELVQRLERERGRSFESHELIGRVHDELGNADEALAAYRAALATNPSHIDTRVRLIQILTRAGRMDDVIAEYRELLRRVPGEPRFVVELAQLLMQTGRREEALSMAEQTSRRHPRDSGVHQALAELYTEWGEEELARREVQVLARIEPNDPAHLIALGSQQYDAGNTEQAITTWRRILSVGQDRADAYGTLGGVFADHDLLEEAEEAYRQAVRLDENDVSYIRGLANVLERRAAGTASSGALNDEAIRQWGRLLELPDVDRAARREARNRIVGIYARRGQLQRQLAQWRTAFFATPPDVDAGRFLASAYLRARPPQAAEADGVLARVISLEPGDLESLVALERVRTTQGDLAGAIEILRRLVEADPRRAPSYLQRLAEHALALYRDDEAVGYAEMAVERTPDDANAHRRLGDLYRARQDVDRAIGSYRRAIELNDRLFETYFELAEIHLARSQPEEADGLLRNVMQASPDDDLVVRATRASMQIHLGAGTLEILERDLLPLAIGNPRRPIYRRLIVELYDAHAMPLIARLQSGGAEASEAQDELTLLGTRAIQPLLQALADSDPGQQRIAIGILGHLGNENAAAPLLAAAEGNGEMELRVRALLAAGALSSLMSPGRVSAGARVAASQQVDRFVALAEGEERRLRGPATWSLSRMGGPASLRALQRLLENGDPTVRGYAAIGLGRARLESARFALERHLQEERHVQVQAAAAWALGQISHPESVPSLVAALEIQGPVSRGAAHALGRVRDPRAQDSLARGVFDPDPGQQSAAARAFRHMGLADRSLGDEVDVLPVPLSGMDAAGYVDLILAHDGARRASVAVDLGSYEAALTQAANDALRGPLERRRAALQILASGERGIGLGLLTAGMESWPEALRADGEHTLRRIALRILPELIESSTHPDAQIRELSVGLLARIEHPEAASALVTALSDRDASVQRAALMAVSEEGSATQIVARVGELLLTHPEWSTRLRAAEALGRVRSDEGVYALCESASHDDYAYVRARAAQSLGEIGAERARRTLEEVAARDVEAAVREAARRALDRLSD